MMMGIRMPGTLVATMALAMILAAPEATPMGETLSGLKEKGLDLLFTVLVDNDAYHALKAVDSLIITGLTRTNVNDVAVALLKR